MTGHSFSGQWFEKYDPLLHDAVMGPVEAFSPLGYEEASCWTDILLRSVSAYWKRRTALRIHLTVIIKY